MKLPPSLEGQPEPRPEPKSGEPYKYVPRVTDDEVFPKWKPRLRTGGIVVGVAILLIAGYALIHKRPDSGVYIPDARISAVSQWTADPGLSIAPGFSHDGKLVAYASDRGGAGSLAIWMRPFPSGEPTRLTAESFNDSDPDFSPDDTRIVYRSEKDGGGIYIAARSGTGTPRRLVAGGLRPRFSPDGKWIACYDGTVPGNRIFIVSPEGGEPRQIRSDFLDSRSPVWSPDSLLLLFEGTGSAGMRDWWVTPLDGGAAKATHALQRLSHPAVHAPERWWNGKILYSATEQDYPHLWEVAISSADWEISGPPRKLTNGDAIEQVAAVGKDGRLLFTRMLVAADVWSQPVNAGSGTAAGQLRQVTDDHGVNESPSVTIDGTRLVYVSKKSGLRDIWVRDLATGQENSITRFTQVGYRPTLSPDGNRIVYPSAGKDGQCAVVVKNLLLKSPDSILRGCFNTWSWSPDGSSLAVYTPDATIRSVDIFKIDAGERRPLLSHPSYNFFDAAFSPIGGWITFTAGSSAMNTQIYVAPFRGSAIRDGEWIPITREGGRNSAWSPDGGVLYFHSNRDGFPCIWSQKLDAARRPVGSAQAVLHLHSVAFGTYLLNPVDFHISVARDRLVLNLTKETANLWVTAKP